ncbi:hypothetical protein [Micromonospora sp. NPDC005324]|uniref:hypothetical protein n=1 Tax=Micromonospora sp. NPDC005324 TaxID=3157033 RepID=UPI0033A39487
MVMPSESDPVTRQAVVAPAPAGLSKSARRRRALAEQVGAALVNPLPPEMWYSAADVITMRLFPTRVGDDPAMRRPLVEAPEVVQRGGPGALWVGSGPGGVVVRVHGPSWSLVVRVSGVVVDAIVLFLDQTSRYGWRVEDDVDARELIEDAVQQVVDEAVRYGWGGDKYTPPGAPVA